MVLSAIPFRTTNHTVVDVLFAQCDHLLDGAIHAGILHVNEIAHGPHVRILGNVHRNGIEERLLPAKEEDKKEVIA